MSRVSGSTDAAADLKEAVKSSMEELEEAAASMRQKLAMLAQTDHDESYETAEYYCRYLENFCEKFEPCCTDVIRRLDAYISFLQLTDHHMAMGRSTSFPAGASSGRSGPRSQILSGAGTGLNPGREVWQLTNDGAVYDSPDKNGMRMRGDQILFGQSSGCCGLCAIENLTTEAEQHSGLEQIYNMAIRNGLCESEGGTTAESRQLILGGLGINSCLEEQSIENIAAAVAEGRGVILSVDASRLKPYGYTGLSRLKKRPHAILVTSVRVDANGRVTHIIVCDSNHRGLGISGAHAYPVEDLKKAFMKHRRMNVTERIR